MMSHPIDLEFLKELSKAAGKGIMDIYTTDFSVDIKSDDSPLTKADTCSHEIISAGLKKEYPAIPILSEEGKTISFEERKQWQRFWLVDPLDGTKEFIKKNDEFTVNIALIENHIPVAGAIYAPALDLMYLADVETGCWEITREKQLKLEIVPPIDGDVVRVVQSRSHPSKELTKCLNALPPHEAVSRGSSLKFCLVAAGKADLYPRLGPTWEWDTGAGQAVVTAAGGIVTDTKGVSFKYNKANLLNGPFFVGSNLNFMENLSLF
ncbi:3'(2'),5'-bisphosphate nucleotidase [Desulfocicer vacuolatum DSM 3385]|uniref:3'(2'),5'-bisphosphate nucleotidase CysQ n=1 Tax=Desulfocicer vacuolatum DSM 3385 TaxID=1121400 RepID=A0A1W2DNZ4_9BACT|nr:3'(2'),5'-bisphosphate nucleotidase CysQ [Desulfocicer vacuolatum]SMC99194.1 3'(2'),5'-bisphosphate nucleotidase [Desulfocicer vacuolatum DSM 3385]